jgi:hypothetical protein
MSDSDDDFYSFDAVGVPTVPVVAAPIIAFQTDAMYETIIAEQRAIAEIDKRFADASLEFNPDVKIATKSYKQVQDNTQTA